MLDFFHDVLIVPIYNLLIFFVDVVPGGDLGLAVILVTLVVKLLILPLSLSAVRTQRAMKAVEPKLKEVQEKYKDDRERQAKELFALYKEHKIRPFASFGAILIQLPILICLYLVFQSKNLSTVDVSLLYAFIPVPETISTEFLGLIAIAGTSIVLALLAAVTQFAQAYYAIPVPPKKENATATEDFGRALALQSRIILPLIIGAVAFTSGAIALYFITSNIFGVAQEFVARRLYPKVS